MSPQEFANKIRTKYPGAYDGVSDIDLAQKVIAKYPVYANTVDFNQTKVQEYVNNYQKDSAGNFVLKNTPKLDLLGKTTSVVNSIFPGKQVGEAIGTAGGALYTKAKDLITGTNNFSQYDLSSPTPVQVAGDIAKGVATVAGLKAPIPVAETAMGIIGKTALQSGLTGSVIGAGESAIQNPDSLKEIAKGGLVGGAVGGAIGGTTSAFGQLLSKVSDKIQLSLIKPSKSDIADGFSINTVKKYNLGGSLNQTLEKTDSKLSELSTQLSQKLSTSKQTVNLNKIVDETISELTDSSKLKGFGANTKIQNVLSNLKNEVSIVGNELTIPDAQVVKQASGSFGAWQYGKPDPDSKATEIVYNTFYSKLKNAIEKASPSGVKEINQELSKLIPIKNAVIRRIPITDRNNLISLSDMIGLVGSSVNPVALGPTLLNVLSKTGVGAKIAGKIGSGLTKSAVPLSIIGQQAAQGLNRDK